MLVQPLTLVLAEGVPQPVGLLAEFAADLPQPRFPGDQREDRIGSLLLRIVASVGLLAGGSKGIAIVVGHGCASPSFAAMARGPVIIVSSIGSRSGSSLLRICARSVSDRERGTIRTAIQERSTNCGA